MYNFPSEFVPDSVKKQPDYGVQYFRSAWQYYGGFTRFNTRQNLMKELRRWGMGLQSVENMKGYFNAKDGDTVYMNLDWSAPAILASYRDKIVDKIKNIPLEISLKAIDPLSNTKRMDKENELRVKMKLKNENQYFKEQYGIGLYDEEESELPESEEDLGIFMDLKYRLQSEIAMTAGVNWLFYLGGDTDLKTKWDKDQVDLGVSLGRILYNDDGLPYPAYVDPARFICSFSEQPDFSDLVFGFELKYKTLGEIKKESGFSDAEIEQLAKFSLGRYGNPMWYNTKYFADTPYAVPPYYSFKVAVLEGEFLSLEYKEVEAYETFRGRMRVVDKNSDKKNTVVNIKENNPRSDKKVDEATLKYQNVYTGTWIIDTDKIYKYGLAENILRYRKDNKLQLDTKLSYFGYMPDMRDMTNKGMVERMRPHAEQMHLSILKVQQELAAAAPSGYEVDINLVSGIMLGKGEGVGNDNMASPLEVMDLYQQTGRLFTNRAKFQQTGGAAIYPLTGISREAILAHIETFNFHKSILESSIGGSAVAYTGSPSPDALVGVQKLAAAAVDNALGNTVYGYAMCIENMAKLLCLHLQSVVEDKNIGVLAKGLGDEYIRPLKLTRDEALGKYGISIRYVSRQEEKFVLQQYIQVALRGGLISLSDAYLLETQILNPQQAWAYLKQAEAKEAKRKQAEALQLSQANAQAQAQAGQAVEQARQQTAMLNAQSKMAEIAAQGQVDDEKLDDEHNYKLEEIDRKGFWDLQLAKEMGNQKRTFQNSDMLK